MAFAQLTNRDSLRDTFTCLNAHARKLYSMGIHGDVVRSTLADANETRDWRLYAAFTGTLISQARKLYAEELFGAEVNGTAYALDTTCIDLFLSPFPGDQIPKDQGGNQRELANGVEVQYTGLSSH